MSVATPIVNPSTVSEARNLWARMESTANTRLSARPIMSYGDFSPVLACLDHQFGGGAGERQVLHLLAVDLDGAGFDFARGVAHRFRQPNFSQQLVEARAIGCAHTLG